MAKTFWQLNIESVGQSPCEKYACRHQILCKTRYLGCEALVGYVKYGRATTFGNRLVADGKKQFVELSGESHPTYANYKEAMNA